MSRGEVAPTFPAALTRFDLPKDPITRQYTSTLPVKMGIVHGLNRLPEETRILAPWYIEDPRDHQASPCGARVKVILPMPLSLDDPDGRWECQRILRDDPPPPGRPEHWYSPTQLERTKRRAYFREPKVKEMLRKSSSFAQNGASHRLHSVCWIYRAKPYPTSDLL